MGLRGRFMMLVAAGVGISFIGYCIGAFCFGQFIGMGICLVLIVTSLITIFIKQKQGLHSKSRSRDILIYNSLFIKN